MKYFFGLSIYTLIGASTSGICLLYFIIKSYDKDESKKVPRRIRPAATTADEKSISRVDKRGRLPLHIAVSKNNSDLAQGLQVIELYIARTYLYNAVVSLIEANREDASVADTFYGALPIHYAVHHDAEDVNCEVVRYLIEAYPEGTCVPDGAGFLPLHRAGTN
jgi:ankyrin repeat protein